MSNESSPLAREMLLDAAQRALELAKLHGATAADVIATRSKEFEVKVADGEIVTLTQAVSKGLGLRVLVGGRLGLCTTSDFRGPHLEQAVVRGIQVARETVEDPLQVLPQTEAGTLDDAALDLYDPAVASLEAETKIDWAHNIEQAARAADPHIRKFRDSGVATSENDVVIATSRGAIRKRQSTNISMWCNPLAVRDDELQTELWWDTKTHLADLESPEEIGRTAAIRAARMLGAKRVSTQRVPIIFEPGAATSLIAGMLSALDGDAVYKKASFLADKLGETIGSNLLSVIDDPLLQRGVGSSPFDDEGLPTYRKSIIDRGKLATFLYDSHSARKAGVEPTANGRRSLGGRPHAAAFNLVVAAGKDSPEEIAHSVPRALLVTRGLGRGLNTVSGDYSRGVNGLWLEGGEPVHPVQEVTIAGDFLTMLQSIDRVGTDVRARGTSAAPTLRIAEMTVSGS